jgi:histidyl-tRNA synthetase
MMAQYLGLDAVQAQFMVKLLDKKNKIDYRDFVDQAKEIFGELAETGIPKLEALVKAESMADLPQEICESSVVAEVQELFTLLERAEVKSLVFDITLMRGLDYYTGTVFEVFDTNPENSRSLFGGGRYDGLVGLFGVDPVSAVGMAPGGTTIEEFLKGHNLVPKLPSTTQIYAVTVGDTAREAGRAVMQLRESGLNVELDTSGRKLDKQIKIAIKKDIPYIMFIGEEEIQNGIYTVKDIEKSVEQKLSLDDIVKQFN